MRRKVLESSKHIISPNDNLSHLHACLNTVMCQEVSARTGVPLCAVVSLLGCTQRTSRRLSVRIKSIAQMAAA